MSDKTEAKSEGEGGGKKKKALLFAIIGVVVVLLAGGGGAAWFFMSKGKEEHAVEAEKRKPRTPPVFVTLEPFVVNLAGEVQHYLQVGIDLKVAEAAVGDRIKAHLPEIRNGVLLLLSSKNVEELGSLEGKNRLRAEIRAAVNGPLGIEASPSAAHHSAGQTDAAGQGGSAVEGEGVQEVLLTSFVIQ
ncbi:MAG: flagellar basal body-associated protein FliL [Burkholderiales bacterium]|nr:flagellar basal body-associated protein FliL [Burkholderiales bacterium]